MELGMLAAEFYTLVYTEELARDLGVSELRSKVSTRLDAVATQGTELILSYLFPACLGEARHVSRSYREVLPVSSHIFHLRGEGESPEKCMMCNWFKTTVLAKTGGYYLSRGQVHALSPPTFATRQEVLAYVAELFFSLEVWSSGYGGPLWGAGAALGAEIGRGNPRSICDRAFNLAHNGGTLFSKGIGGITYSKANLLYGVLETKARAKHFGQYGWMAPLASPTTFELYKEAAGLALKRGDCILWDGEGRDADTRE